MIGSTSILLCLVAKSEARRYDLRELQRQPPGDVIETFEREEVERTQ